jgi:hypothetical protein
MTYGHGNEISQVITPMDDLEAAIRKLRAWADLNPDLVPLYKYFERTLERLKQA